MKNDRLVKSCVCVCLYACACMHTQSCPTLWEPMHCSPPGSSVHGIFQARILEWVAISYRGIFLDQGLNPCLLHWQVDSLPLCTWEAHKELVWANVPCSKKDKERKEANKLAINNCYGLLNASMP